MNPACPHCQHELTSREIAILYSALRKTRAGGRPKLPRCYLCLLPVREPYRQDEDGRIRHLNACPLAIPQSPSDTWPLRKMDPHAK